MLRLATTDLWHGWDSRCTRMFVYLKILDARRKACIPPIVLYAIIPVPGYGRSAMVSVHIAPWEREGFTVLAKFHLFWILGIPFLDKGKKIFPILGKRNTHVLTGKTGRIRIERKRWRSDSPTLSSGEKTIDVHREQNNTDLLLERISRFDNL